MEKTIFITFVFVFLSNISIFSQESEILVSVHQYDYQSNILLVEFKISNGSNKNIFFYLPKNQYKINKKNTTLLFSDYKIKSDTLFYVPTKQDNISVTYSSFLEADSLSIKIDRLSASKNVKKKKCLIILLAFNNLDSLPEYINLPIFYRCNQKSKIQTLWSNVKL